MSQIKPDRKVEIPADMLEFNRKLIAEFRANHGEMSGPMAGRQLMLLTTTGARTGEARTVVIGYRPSADKYVVIASNNGAESDPAWYQNLLANPKATVEVGPEKHYVQGRTASGDERKLLGALVEYLEAQQNKTSRAIPVVVLERRPS